ncbi:Na+/H+ antiporter [Pararobbsia silviterrae]|uniref:Na+/H+ antiporter n=1 Tax=Pararobbsia silviterrae TaxID=1792498 RepID=A0A494XV13_9BURK|nr:Na+/H+ antiporter [Pararobbsia silviterrae]RKP51909.1 Na+/H+ antiporter [Pararobbsia silviterrae]
MDTVFTILILLVAVAASGIDLRIRALPFRVPLPLIQIAIGALLSWPTLGLHVVFEPSLFMLLFVPPLLFADGWRIPKRELFQYRHAVGMLALGLVLMTVLVVGYVAHAIVPSMSLPVAFALAAVLSPTDAVALNGIVGKRRMPAQLMHILEGEALTNDASGLVALKFAIVAAVTGVFSLRDAALSFVIISIGGVVTGIAISGLFSVLSARVIDASQSTDPAPGVVMTVMIPFAAYLFAEHFGWSGILAAVAAGMAMNFTGIARATSAAARVRAASTWSMIEFVFNGMVFILLGLQLPHIIVRAIEEGRAAGHDQAGVLIADVFAVLVVLYAVRFGWVWLLRSFTARRSAQHGMANAVPGTRFVAITTIAGVRGAVTLAGVLSLPVIDANGAPLAGRHIAIFIAAGVILLSLLIAVAGLPLLLRGARRFSDPHADEERRARRIASHAAIEAIVNEQHRAKTDPVFAQLAAFDDIGIRVLGMYERRLAVLEEPPNEAGDASHDEALELRLRIAGMQAQRRAVLDLHARQKINDATLNKLVRESDLLETALIARARPHADARQIGDYEVLKDYR